MNKRFFIDAWLMPLTTNDAIDMVTLAGELGFKAVVVEGSDEILKASSEVAARLGIELYRRRTINVNKKEKLYDELSKNRWSFELISVKSNERDVIMAALRDMRVDTVLMSHPSAPLVDRHMLSVANNIVEVAFSDILKYGYETFYRVLRLSPHLKKDRIRVVVSSCATNCFEMRSPRQLASVFFVMGVGSDRAVETVSGAIIEALRQNKAKLEGMLDSSGVWRVER